jgi:hypothetical protein
LGDKWFKLNQSQQEAHLKKFHTAEPCDEMSQPHHTLQDEHNTSITKTCSLSVYIDEFPLKVQLPTKILKSIWQKAENLLCNQEMIVAAPGMESSWFVNSTSKQMPHLVCISRNGTVSCDKECEHYPSININFVLIQLLLLKKKVH